MNIGIDIIQNSRITNISSLAKRILSQSEFREFALLTNDSKKREYVSGRWAAKEAIIKCIADNTVIYSKINIKLDQNKLIAELTNYKLIISISHETDYSVAVAICI